MMDNTPTPDPKVNGNPVDAPADALLGHWARVQPQAPAIGDPLNREDFDAGPARNLNFAEADQLVGRLARSFLDHGLQPGDRIVIQLPNVWESPLAIIAAWRAGLVPCVFPLLWRGREIDAALQALAPRAIVTISRFGGHDYALAMRDAAARQISVRFILGIDENAPDGVTPITQWLVSGETPDAGVSGSATPGTLAGGLIAWSAAPPEGKALLHNSAGLSNLGQSQIDLLHFSSRDVLLNPYPFSSLIAVAGFLLPWLQTGARLVLHQPFDLAGFGEQLIREQATYTAVPAPVVGALMRSGKLPAESQISRLGCVWPMGLTVRQAGDAPEPAMPVFDIHNLEEYALIVRPRELGADPNALPLGRIGGGEDGEHVLETRVRGFVSSSGEAADSLNGEVLLRGRALPQPLGIGGETTDFIATGIRCFVHGEEQTRFHCTPDGDRIHHGGVTLSAAELDALYGEFPGFIDAAAFGIEDPIMGHRVIAAVVPHPNATPSLSEFRDFLTAKDIAPFKLPDQMVIAKTIPRGPDGAIDRAGILNEI